MVWTINEQPGAWVSRTGSSVEEVCDA